MKRKTLCFLSSWQRFKGIRKFKKEHRNVKILEKGIDVSGEQGYKCKGITYLYWVTLQYDD